jgi:ribosomal protein S18 acetylase RimI-like enzyme
MNLEQVKIRHAKKKDTKKIIELLAQLDRPLPRNPYLVRKFRIIIGSYIDSNSTMNTSGVIVASVDSRIIGMVSFVVIDRLNHPFSEFWIPELVVSKEFRNKGIGKLLINKCESIARKKRCYRIRLESRSDRIYAHNFYKKIGFRHVALVFEKRLSGKGSSKVRKAR